MEKIVKDERLKFKFCSMINSTFLNMKKVKLVHANKPQNKNSIPNLMYLGHQIFQLQHISTILINRVSFLLNKSFLILTFILTSRHVTDR